MGINWGEDKIGDDCNQFPPGETPKYLWASFSGVERCSTAWSLPSPPNGVYKLTQNTSFPCRWDWYSTPGGIHIMYTTSATSSSISVQTGSFFSFAAIDYHPLIFSFKNGQTCATYPPHPLWGSGSVIVARRQPGTAPAVTNVAELLNIEQEADSMADFYPAADDKVMLKFCRQKTPTNILIIVDYSAFES